jgi:hypothetical protein
MSSVLEADQSASSFFRSANSSESISTLAYLSLRSANARSCAAWLLTVSSSSSISLHAKVCDTTRTLLYQVRSARSSGLNPKLSAWTHPCDLAPIVRRRMLLSHLQSERREYLAHLIGLFRRQICCDASRRISNVFRLILSRYRWSVAQASACRCRHS